MPMRAALLIALSVHADAQAPPAFIESPPVIQTDDGPIQGTLDVLTGVTTYHAIPFAAAPVGALRWRKPQRPAPWNATVYSKMAGHQCPQLDLVRGLHLGQEDCLYASVYVPRQ